MFSRQPKVTATEHERALNELHSVIEELRGELGEIRQRQAEPSHWLERVTTRKVLFHMKGNAPSIEGLLCDNLEDGVVLRSAEMLNSGAAPTRMAGEVFVPRENVLLAQFDG